LAIIAWAALAGTCLAAEPLSSGLQVGQRPMPYSFVLSTGAERGQSRCFICATEERPAVIVFARSRNEATGKLLQKLDKATTDHQTAELRVWATFPSKDQTELDPQLVRWSQKLGLRNVPLGVYEDAAGPPSYRLAPDADLTVLLFVKRKVAATFAFRAEETTDDALNAVLEALPKILPEKP
jgi:hypothetical protein